jgi:hypothetical protein
MPLPHAPASNKKKKTEKKKALSKKRPSVIKQDHQMTLKNCVPSRAILDLIR